MGLSPRKNGRMNEAMSMFSLTVAEVSEVDRFVSRRGDRIATEVMFL